MLYLMQPKNACICRNYTLYKKRLQDRNPDQYTDNTQKIAAIKITEVLKNAYQMIKAYTILDITPDTSFEEIKKK